MKLIYVLPAYDPDVPGHLYHIYELLNELGRRCPRLELALVIERGQTPPPIPGVTKVRVLQFERRAALHLLRMAWCIARLRMQGFRRIYTHYSHYGGIAGGLIMRLTGGKSFYWNCGMMGEYQTRIRWSMASWTRFLSHDLPTLGSFKLTQQLVTGTKTVSKHYESVFKIPAEKILIIPNWVNSRRFAPANADQRVDTENKLGLNSARPRLLFVHRLATRKGHDRIAGIVHQLARMGMRASCVVIGDGDGADEVRRSAVELGVEDLIDIRGAVPNHLVADYFRTADLFIMPSREEGFPRVLLESMASGVPFVACGVGGVLDIVTPNQARYSVLNGEYSAEQFAAFAHRILTDSPLRSTLVQDGLDHFVSFTLPAVAQRFCQVVAGQIFEREYVNA